MPNSEQRRFEHYLREIIPIRSTPFDFKDKERNIRSQLFYMLNRTQSMFRWNGLPDSIPERIVELYLQINGNLCFSEVDGTLYVFVGGLGGEPDVYYMPTKYVIANPALEISKTLTIDSDCIVIPNDTMYMGLLPLLRKYCTLLAENELSIDIATVNSRIIALLSASDDRTKQSAERYLEQIHDGDMGIIAENAFLNGVRSQPIAANSNSNFITNLIELEQYTKASMFNEIGLNANYNMKRESLNSSESQLNNDALLPLVDDMLKCRQIGVEKVNKMFGTNITVELASSWEDNEIEIEKEQESIDDNEQESTDEGEVTEDESNDTE